MGRSICRQPHARRELGRRGGALDAQVSVDLRQKPAGQEYGAAAVTLSKRRRERQPALTVGAIGREERCEFEGEQE